MRNFASEKSIKIARTLETLQYGDETLRQVSEIILNKVELYDGFLKSWDNPGKKWSMEEIKAGKECSNAGLDMAYAITNELRILLTKRE